MKYKAQCSCGAVIVELSNEPFQQILCHCKNCRAWSASPVTSATLFKPEDVVDDVFDVDDLFLCK